MGVWIETSKIKFTADTYGVTPCMGVWIETSKLRSRPTGATSHPVWVCGLKLTETGKSSSLHGVTPCMGVWIETSRANP